ncbi:SprT family zinc-dependent metalloprotease [Lentilitoribacter sp. Alg239-R112]|uniref:M48 family metallopeptidase n=1 Tax=Lentilitoribacter sp. Alg239-R112 TaxID=2305987 RepID=UPI0013A6BDCD|nr:SprT family zinc-dependent metalloprotease [Lentilitoribacter sp. Alg239-R112]
MNIGEEVLEISGIIVDLTRKPIKNVHLSVHPPMGSVRLSVPSQMSTDVARLAVIRRLKWIQQKRTEFEQQARESERLYISGESHFFDGQRLILDVRETDGKGHASVIGNGRLALYVRKGASQKMKSLIVDRFYRKHLQNLISLMQPDWESKLLVSVEEIRIQRMKTRWGSCNPDTGRVLLNLELAKKPKKCFEFILVHELVHLLERHHNQHFISLMDGAMPDWRQRKELLKSYPLAYETWEY